jgi:hypothetical protein
LVSRESGERDAMREEIIEKKTIVGVEKPLIVCVRENESKKQLNN